MHTCVGQCTDGVKDGNETDVDCGGGSCPPCATGKKCAVNNDCISTDQCQAGVCIACAAGYNQPCGKCNGLTECNGTCSKPTSANLGLSCSACGTYQCDGSCAPATPSTYNQPCGHCGGKVLCNGACSVATPANYGQSCGKLLCPCGYSIPKVWGCTGTCVASDVCSCCGKLPC
jgi:hypothetical protein